MSGGHDRVDVGAACEKRRRGACGSQRWPRRGLEKARSEKIDGNTLIRKVL